MRKDRIRSQIMFREEKFTEPDGIQGTGEREWNP